ncbi:MAG: hypothetical protein NC213_09995 [Acetobacter sp.]|nr:hypothetical protein [Bacteroides sp.]MCM1342064.1 hypothetical protein [Acetobacter sp.]MCM1432732.1 hypothetical protein [Clostridiales bacterium]
MTAFGSLFLLEVMIAFSFVISSLFMFIPKKNESVHKIFFSLAVLLAVFITIIDATSLPSNMQLQTVLAWVALVPAGIGVIITAFSGKPSTLAKLLVMVTSILGALGYFFFL